MKAILLWSTFRVLMSLSIYVSRMSGITPEIHNLPLISSPCRIRSIRAFALLAGDVSNCSFANRFIRLYSLIDSQTPWKPFRLPRC